MTEDRKLIADALGSAPYPRDLRGHGPTPPDPRWPGGAKIAVSFVVNFEEGGERSILHGDATSEVFLHEVPGGTPRAGLRDEQVESIYDYGMRAGFWRVMRLFAERGIPFTSWAVGMAVARYPEAARAMHEAGHEVASHGWRWIDYSGLPEELERQHMRLAIAAIREATGARPLGWYTGRLSSNTRRLVAEEGGFLYSSDAYDDDLPHWAVEGGKPQLVIPYTLDNNDMKFGQIHGFATGDQFFTYLKDAFDMLYREGEAGSPKMMSVGLHLRLVGRPGRAAALARFLDYVQSHDAVWLPRRIDIARHWMATHPYEG
ncbi:allantoinase PuuE [Oceanibaculum pacificum]|uniref:Chitooligosaccharide deacetylase n=1 Tax=Oceanibaculum pacificum TaxID=580166 RepID=A0A154WGD4_9PROT|nr:allantoinase PuuE [Oceanibaculum pacificum]KZD12572.1 allantoinase [Oceanibaculum pacificum]